MMRFYLCNAADVPEGGALGFDLRGGGGDRMFIVRKNGRLYGWRDACPHYGDTPMAWRKNAYLDAASTRIICAAHGAQFDIETGICMLGPCLGKALQQVELSLTQENDIYISPTGERRHT